MAAIPRALRLLSARRPARMGRGLSVASGGSAWTDLVEKSSGDNANASSVDDLSSAAPPPSHTYNPSAIDRGLSRISLDCVLDEGATVDVWVAKKATDVVSWIQHSGLLPFVTETGGADSPSSGGSKAYVGFDIEWRPTFLKGHSAYKTALIQISTDKSCLLVQMIYLDSIPAELSSLLLSKRVVKVGVGVLDDIKKAAKDHLPELSIHESAYVDIGALAKTVERAYCSSRPSRASAINSSGASADASSAAASQVAVFYRHGLKALTRRYLKIDMEKPKKVTMSNWEHVQLTLQQIKYATFDAYLSKHVYNKLNSASSIEKCLTDCDDELISANHSSAAIKDTTAAAVDSHNDLATLGHKDAVSYLEEILRLRSTHGLSRREFKYLHNSPLYNTIEDPETKVRMNHMIYESDMNMVAHLDQMYNAMEENHTDSGAIDIPVGVEQTFLTAPPYHPNPKEGSYRTALHLFLARISCGYTAKRLADGPDANTSPRAVHIYAHLRHKGGVREGSYLLGSATHRNSALAGEAACRQVYIRVLSFLRKHLVNSTGDLVRVYSGFDAAFVESVVQDFLYESDRRMTNEIMRAANADSRK